MKVILSKQFYRTNLTEQIKYWLHEISKIKNYFHEEINERKSCSKKLRKYVPAFDYIELILIVLSATTLEYQLFCL